MLVLLRLRSRNIRGPYPGEKFCVTREQPRSESLFSTIKKTKEREHGLEVGAMKFHELSVFLAALLDSPT